MVCTACGHDDVGTLCAEHQACLPCHEHEMKTLWQEIGNLARLVQQLQAELRKRKGMQTPRALGSRIIGSMWNPSDPTEKDDIRSTVRSIHKHLGIGGS